MTRREARHSLSRRTFLAFTGISTAAFVAGTGVPPHAAPTSSRVPADPFGLGVASGDPTPNSVVLWTRLAPEPLAEDGHGGMPSDDYTVEYEVATDERFRDVVTTGRAIASAELAHSVHPHVTGLKPGREYYYRFRAAGEISPTGRTRTAPAENAEPDSLALAVASCQAWYHGHYTAYRDMAEQDLDLLLFLGDYIYEYGITEANLLRGGAGDLGTAHAAAVLTLEQYRLRYSLTKSDTHLQAAHAHAPWVMIPDDHEVENNYAGEASESGIPAEDFLRRRAVAYRALYENLPLGPEALPAGPDMRLYRRLRFGRLAEFNVLDTRQYRHGTPADGGTPGGDHTGPDRSLLGQSQEEWLYSGLRASEATWNVLAQQVVMASIDRDPGSGVEYSMDMWDGFTANRKRLFDTLTMHDVSNPLVLSGDIHRHAAAELKSDFTDPASATIGTELVATSVASDGNGSDRDYLADIWLSNPHVKLYNARRGYVRVTMTPSEVTSEFTMLDQIEADDSGTASVGARFVTEAGRPGLNQVSGGQQ
ncbi:alkaline phosphatase D [Lipingzhangella halophila]|uniref:Alkaline phosphatase D n=1 Tax=Lipingzhangella halophila TaxID=1783352 RepID=A0A7W7W6Z3_9ACTN|nr:alkaline phosphatase D family protein [Lipingzhangella halophila]MBB4935355.1 alkaline phosphatase D [Lipingzhangella halophila]